MQMVFVTGATGLLGNNLVKMLVAQGYRVKALVRSFEKAQMQFGDLLNLNDSPIEVVVGDMARVDEFASHLKGCKVLFHTAAYFKESYKGGNHATALQQTNVAGTVNLLTAAYEQGIRRVVHTSSIAVVTGAKGSLIDEGCDRDLKQDATDDYFRSKVESEQAVREFVERHKDMFASFILPGWMWGPGDIGPTAAGQFLTNVVKGRLPMSMKGSFSLVDARDVAQAHIAVAFKDAALLMNSERFLVAGRHITMTDLVQEIGKIAEVKVPRVVAPTSLIYVCAALFEGVRAITGKEVLISWAAVKLMQQENDRTHFDSSKAKEQLGIEFRPLNESIKDTLKWFKEKEIL